MEFGITEQLILNVHELKKLCLYSLHYSFIFLINRAGLAERKTD